MGTASQGSAGAQGGPEGFGVVRLLCVTLMGTHVITHLSEPTACAALRDPDIGGGLWVTGACLGRSVTVTNVRLGGRG